MGVQVTSNRLDLASHRERDRPHTSDALEVLPTHSPSRASLSIRRWSY